jgi:hypothetical protein
MKQIPRTCMIRIARIACESVLAAILATASTAAMALPQRTFVASGGDDANPCTLALPCRGFTAALLAVNAGGEIVVLDSAGYGPVTIDKSVAIVAPPGIYAGITVTNGNGITMSTPGIDVRLKGLTITGLGGLYGIRVTAGSSLRIEDCTIANIGWGLRVDGPVLVDVRNARFDRTSGAGIWVQDGTTLAVIESGFVSANYGVKIVATTSPTTTRANVSRSTFFKTYVSLGATGAPTAGNVYASISDSTFTGDDTTGAGYLVLGDCQPSASCVADQVHVAATRNVVTGAHWGALYANATGVTIVATQNTISDSGTGFAGVAGGAIWSLQDNAVYKNALDTNGTVVNKTYR